MNFALDKTVWRLLRHNISPGQIIGYAAANLVGLAIVLTALQFYRDVTASTGQDDTFISRDYLIISKRVEGFGSLVGDPVSFSDDEIADISSRPWVRRVGRFATSGFNVGAAVEMGGRSMSTALFFESIPDEFFDVRPVGWSFDPDNPEIPIVISREYLALYNFGFAASRGLPQLSESVIGMVPLRVSVSGNGRQQYLPARIVGFSSRLNTIAVPESFMQWANGQFADSPAPQPSRLIVEVSSPGDPAIAEYLASHGYETAGDKADSGRLNYFMRLVTGVVVGVGAVISLLALFILLLSVYLLLQKNRDKLRDLMLLGYTPSRIASHYYIIVAAVNAVVLLLAVGVVMLVRGLWSGPLGELGLSVTSPWAVIGIGVLLIVVVTGVNVAAIRCRVRRYFYA